MVARVMMRNVFITPKSSLVPLIEGLLYVAQIHVDSSSLYCRVLLPAAEIVARVRVGTGSSLPQNCCELLYTNFEHIYIYNSKATYCTDWYRYRVAKTHRMPYLHRSLSAKEPYN